jgi:hypothetical protein
MHADLNPLPPALPAFKREARHVPQVARWAFDAEVGHITGVDEHGRVLMFVATSPLFGPRLAAAFGAAGAGQTPPEAGPWRPAFPF